MAVPLRELARAAGLDPDYTSWRGTRTSSSDEAVRQALHALAPDLGIDVEADDALVQLERRRWIDPVGPVVVAWDGELEVPLYVRAEVDAPWSLEVTTEDGRTFAARGMLYDLPADSHANPDEVVHCVRRVRLSLDGQLGYHTVHWTIGDARGEAMAIAAPTRAWGAPDGTRRRWGVFAPVYGLGSTRSGAAGDSASLRTLFEAVERRGGSYVATLPLLAAFLDGTAPPAGRAQVPAVDEPYAYSPYSPASRLHWNELYVDLARFAASLELPIPSAPPAPPGLIDYRAQYAWRRPILDALAKAFFTDPDRAAAVGAWATERGVWDYAAFRAFGEAQRTSWHAWPAQLRDGTKRARSRADAVALGADPARIDTHVFGQWAMQTQLEALQGGRCALYLDLPVGVSMDAYEVWRWRRLFVTSLAAGAPPDALFLGGQNWGLPPMSPIALRRGKYRYFIDCVRHHMGVSGMLRIDHVMGLFRLYCVPEGRPATDGVYLRYPADEMLAILTLESSRAVCAVAGEDLGTVPDRVRPAMAKHGLYRLHVAQWSFPTHAGAASDPAPAGSIASLDTHDTATFAGWWHGADITDKRELGLIDDAQETLERAERDRVRAAVLALAPPASGAADPRDELERAMIAATAELAHGPAAVVLVALDDIALEPVPHNVPGTTTERPNWQRRVPGWEEALDAPAIHVVVAARPAE